MTSWDPTQKEDTGAPTQPRPAPATDEEIAAFTGDIAIYRREYDGKLHCTRCYAESAGHRPGCDHALWPSIKARIEADRADVDRLRARVAELKEVLKAAIGHCDCLDYNGKALIPCTEANPCAGCYMAAQIRAALKPEPR